MLLLPQMKPPLVPRIPSVRTIPGLISVVTPSFNQGRFIGECIDSVRQQAYPNLEHIIVDGGSMDKTVEILRKYNELIWVSEPDRGQSHALNKAIRISRGEYTFWLNSDDVMLPGALEDVVNAFKRNPSADVLVYGFEMIDMKGTYIGEKLPGPRMKWMDGRFSPVDCFPTPAIVFRRSVPERIGGLDESIVYPMDLELLCRARAEGCNVLFLDRYAVRYRYDENSKNFRPADNVSPLLEQYDLHRRFWPNGIRRVKYWIRTRSLLAVAYRNLAVSSLSHRNHLRGWLSWHLFLLNAPLSIPRQQTWGLLLRALGLRR